MLVTAVAVARFRRGRCGSAFLPWCRTAAGKCTAALTPAVLLCSAGVYANKLALFGMAIKVFFESCNPLLHVSTSPLSSRGRVLVWGQQ